MNRRKWWITSKRVGSLKKIYLRLLRKVFGFTEWHLSPINERPYGQEVVRSVNKYVGAKKAVIVEVGCGLGEIIANCAGGVQKSAYDINLKNIRAAKLLHPWIKCCQGSFSDVTETNIDVLIMVNFIFLISPEELNRQIKNLLIRSNIKMFVIDTYLRNENTEYTYSHDGNELFDGQYRLIKKSKGYSAAHGARRYIECWEKIHNS